MNNNEKSALLSLYNSAVAAAIEYSRDATTALQNKNYSWYGIYVEKMRVAEGKQQAIQETLRVLGYTFVTGENGVAIAIH